jgi:hypothetical protein
MGVIVFGFGMFLFIILITVALESFIRKGKINNRKTNVVVNLKNHTSWRR